MNQSAPCPKCRQSNAQKVNFTWWGGVIGPKMINHVKCQTCGAKYNGKSGKDNTTYILLYTFIVGIIAFVVFFAASLLFFSIR